jgi:4-alpha-glucanotransferase
MTGDEQHVLDRLADRFGIEAEYDDIYGRRHVVSADTKRAILSAMGIQTGSLEAMRTELGTQEDRLWRQPCDTVLVARVGSTPVWSFRMPVSPGQEDTVVIEWTLRDEAGHDVADEKLGPGFQPAEEHAVGGQRYLRFDLAIPSGLGIGYYTLRVRGLSKNGSVSGDLLVIITPGRCYAPPALQTDARAWGVSVQVYALRSATGWGAGDYGDLQTCVDWAGGALGAGIVGVNPLHVLKNTRPYHISPYSPDSRLFLNTLYIDVERIPEFRDSPEAKRMVEDPGFQARLQAARKSETVDYDEVRTLKHQALDVIFTGFEAGQFQQEEGMRQPRTDRARAFEDYCRQEGESLLTFALFQALQEHFSARSPSLSMWQDWPKSYRTPASAVCRRFLKSHRHRVRFYQYLQWIAHEQLNAVAQRTRELGMSIGLYHDLALGSDRGGTDAWACQPLFALGADSGCPPDAFSPEGQNWGLPPVIPHQLRATRYRMFIDLLRKNARYGGAIRLDHVMALFRLFWIPRGMPASAGAYVRYHREELLGILALESVRLKCVIVGEDLGTVPDGVRERLADAGVLSYRVFYFERRPDGEWKAPGEYPRQALAVVTTHDLPTLTGFWRGTDVDLRRSLGLYRDDAASHQAMDERQRDKAGVLQALAREGLLPSSVAGGSTESELTPDLCEAIHRYLAHAPSMLMLVTLEDLLGEAKQINLPGTLDSYPNWSYKSSHTLDEASREPLAERLASVLRSIRP